MHCHATPWWWTRLQGWRARGTLPLAVECTYNVLHAFISDKEKTVDSLSLRQLYAMTVIR